MATGHHAVHRSAFWPGSDEYRFWHLSHKDSQVHVSHLGPTWVLSAPGRPHVGPMNLAIRTVIALCLSILVRSCRWRHGLLTNTIVRMTSYGIVKSVHQRTWYWLSWHFNPTYLVNQTQKCCAQMSRQQETKITLAWKESRYQYSSHDGSYRLLSYWPVILPIAPLTTDLQAWCESNWYALTPASCFQTKSHSLYVMRINSLRPRDAHMRQ